MAARASLVFLGREDIVLSSDPEVTYFVEKYTGSTLYAKKTSKVQFPKGTINFGSESIIVIPRLGDLLTDMHLKVLMPSFPSTVSALDSVGTLLIDYVEMYIGSLLVERLHGEFMEIKFDLEVPVSKQSALAGLIGKVLETNTPFKSTYLIPLQFSLLKKGLPMCALNELVTIRVVTHPTTFFTSPPTSFDGDAVAYIHAEYAYLGEAERNAISSTHEPRLVEQTQRMEFFAPKGVQNITCQLQFVNLVKELFFVIQTDTAPGYHYSSPYFEGEVQLESLSLSYNSTERISDVIGTPLFLRIIQPLEFHTRAPDRLFFMYSFSLDPESDVPCGSVNMSRIQAQILKLNLVPSYEARDIRVYARSYNFLVVENGKATILFDNT